MNKPLETEAKFFESERDRLVSERHEGKWACIVGARLVGTFDDATAAFEAGVREVGPSHPFLVKQIWSVEPPPQVSTFSMGVLSGSLLYH